MKDLDGSRRQFLRGATRGAIEHAARATEERFIQRRYVRPPGAIPEIGFLAACSRCGECAAACPVSAIKYVDAKGGLAAGTPYLEPDRIACIACDDMPCAASCPTGRKASPSPAAT